MSKFTSYEKWILSRALRLWYADMIKTKDVEKKELFLKDAQVLAEKLGLVDAWSVATINAKEK